MPSIVDAVKESARESRVHRKDSGETDARKLVVPPLGWDDTANTYTPPSTARGELIPASGRSDRKNFTQIVETSDKPLVEDHFLKDLKLTGVHDLVMKTITEVRDTRGRNLTVQEGLDLVFASRRSTEESFGVQLDPDQKDKLRLCTPKQDEYCRVRHDSLRIWHAGQEDAVARGVKVMTPETTLFDGVPVLWFNSDFEVFNFEKRYLKLDTSYNFLYLLADNVEKVEGKKVDLKSQRIPPIYIKLDQVSGLLYGEKAYQLCTENFLIKDSRIKLTDIAMIVRSESEDGRKKKKKANASEERILKLNDVDIILGAPQQFLKRCLNLAIAKNPAKHAKCGGAAQLVGQFIKQIPLIREVHAKYWILENVTLFDHPRETFFDLTHQVVHMDLHFRNGHDFMIPVHVSGSKVVDETGHPATVKQIVQEAFASHESMTAHHTTAISEVIFNFEETLAMRKLTEKSNDILAVIVELIFSEMREALDRGVAHTFTGAEMKRAEKYYSTAEDHDIYGIDMKHHRQIEVQLANADLVTWTPSGSTIHSRTGSKERRSSKGRRGLKEGSKENSANASAIQGNSVEYGGALDTSKVEIRETTAGERISSRFNPDIGVAEFHHVCANGETLNVPCHQKLATGMLLAATQFAELDHILAKVCNGDDGAVSDNAVPGGNLDSTVQDLTVTKLGMTVEEPESARKVSYREETQEEESFALADPNAADSRAPRNFMQRVFRNPCTQR